MNNYSSSLKKLIGKNNSKLSTNNSWLRSGNLNKEMNNELTELLSNGEVHIGGKVDYSPKSKIRATYYDFPCWIEIYASINDIGLGVQDLSLLYSIDINEWKNGTYDVPKEFNSGLMYFPKL